MKKFLVGLLVVGLIAAAAPAMAQPVLTQVGAGSGDPLGLLASGAVVPYFGAGAASGAGGFSLLELYAPRTAANVHMFFYDVNCTRAGDSVNVFLTPNDVEVVRVDDIGGANPTKGLIAMANVDATGFILLPWPEESGVQARVWWVDAAKGYVRVVDPIGVDTWDGHANFKRATQVESSATSTQLYSPMRTSAVYFAPFEGPFFNTTIYFVCPNDNVIGSKSSSGISTRNGFPALVPGARSSTLGPTPIRFRVYDDEEGFLRDVSRTCVCLDEKPLASIATVYTNSALAPFGTYTEVFGGTEPGSDPVCSTTEIVPISSTNPCPLVPDAPGFQFRLITPPVAQAGPYSFVAYRGINIPSGKLDIFGRTAPAARQVTDGTWLSPLQIPNPANGR